jgi:protein-disulfide isomerase
MTRGIWIVVAIVTIGAVAGGCDKQHAASSDTEARLKTLEDEYARHADALAFLDRVYAQQKKQASDDDAREPAPDAVFAVDITEDVRRGQVEGPANAPVTIVKAFDFACPHCARSAPILDELVRENPGKLRIVYKNMVVHDRAMNAHLASCAAAKQGKYLAFKNAFWEKGFGPYAQSGGSDDSSLGTDNILKIADELHLDTGKLKLDMVSPECEQVVKRDMDELAKFKVDGTPTFFINGTEIPGALGKDEFQHLIDEKAKLVAASGIAPAEYYQQVVVGKGEKKFRSKKDTKR